MYKELKKKEFEKFNLALNHHLKELGRYKTFQMFLGHLKYIWKKITIT